MQLQETGQVVTFGNGKQAKVVNVLRPGGAPVKPVMVSPPGLKFSCGECHKAISSLNRLKEHLSREHFLSPLRDMAVGRLPKCPIEGCKVMEKDMYFHYWRDHHLTLHTSGSVITSGRS